MGDCLYYSMNAKRLSKFMFTSFGDKQRGAYHNLFLRNSSWLGRGIFGYLDVLSLIFCVGKKWMFTRKDPLLLTPGASERSAAAAKVIMGGKDRVRN